MKSLFPNLWRDVPNIGLSLLAALTTLSAEAQPTVSRLTPPSELFANQRPVPIIARFLPDQRFDLQATIRPDDASKTIRSAVFSIDGKTIDATISLKSCEEGCKPSIPKNAAIATIRAFSVDNPGAHTFSVTATQSDGQTVTATGNFEIVPFETGGKKIKNIIFMLGDGMGASHRTAARIMAGALLPIPCSDRMTGTFLQPRGFPHRAQTCSLSEYSDRPRQTPARAYEPSALYFAIA